MRIEKATQEQSSLLTDFYESIVLPGVLDFKVDRRPDFFANYRVFSEDHSTFLLRGHHEKIDAMATLLFRTGYLHNREHFLGYATDLRVSSTRRATLEWSNLLLPALGEERKARGCSHIFTVVGQGQRQAYNAFIRPRPMRRKMPRYFLFRKFSLVTVHGRYPWSERPVTGVKIQKYSPDMLDSLLYYLINKSDGRAMTFWQKPDDILRAWGHWKGFAIEDFFIAKDSAGNIIGCTVPWRENHVRKMIPIQYSGRSLTLYDGLRFLSWFRMARALPKEGQPLKACHLNFLNADNPDIFYALLNAAYESSAKDEFLTYLQFEDEILFKPPTDFLHTSQGFGLYFILAPDEPLPDFLKEVSLSGRVDFEPSYLF